jgi:hypothetical protein
MYPRDQLKKFYVYCADKLVAVVHALTDRGAIAQAADLTGYSAARLCAQTTIRG